MFVTVKLMLKSGIVETKNFPKSQSYFPEDVILVLVKLEIPFVMKKVTRILNHIGDQSD